jgi:hypothetical protein
MGLGLNEIEEGEYKYPYKIYEVPIQACFFNLLVVTPAGIYSVQHIDVNDYVDDNTRKYVESVESSYEEEEITE